jgi:hypothetical protein
MLWLCCLLVAICTAFMSSKMAPPAEHDSMFLARPDQPELRCLRCCCAAAVQVLWSTLWSVAIMHHNLQLCAALGSASILIGVVLVTQSSGMDAEEQQLEEQRTLSTLEQRLLSGRVSPLAALARAGSLPSGLWLGRRSSKHSIPGMSPTAVGAGGSMARTFTTEW